MNENHNIQLVKRVYAAFKRSYLNGLLAMFASDFDFEHPMPQTIWAFAGRRKGYQAFVEFKKGSSTVRSFVLIRESGRKGLYVKPPYTQSIESLFEPESRGFWTSLSSPVDVVMCDNCCTLHYAVHDHGDAPRVMHRTTIAGEVPQ